MDLSGKIATNPVLRYLQKFSTACLCMTLSGNIQLTASVILEAHMLQYFNPLLCKECSRTNNYCNSLNNDHFSLANAVCTTLVVSSTQTRVLHSVGLCSVGSPGAIPEHGYTKLADYSNFYEVIWIYVILK